MRISKTFSGRKGSLCLESNKNSSIGYKLVCTCGVVALLFGCEKCPQIWLTCSLRFRHTISCESGGFIQNIENPSNSREKPGIAEFAFELYLRSFQLGSFKHISIICAKVKFIILIWVIPKYATAARTSTGYGLRRFLDQGGADISIRTDTI